MKKLLFLLTISHFGKLSIALLSFVLCPTSLQAQTIPPPYINYQAVLYDVNGTNPNSPLTNQSFTTFVNINDELGNLLYREEHYASTDANGLITVKMGDGLYTAGPITNFNQINWGVGKYYLVVDFDINGTISSTAPEQLVTVPYSFYAGNAGNGMTAVADNGNGTLTFTYANGATYTTPTLSGIQGPAGPVGPSGPSGASGTAGQSAYDLWLAQGNTGTVQDFLSTSAYQIWLAQGNTGTAQDFLNTLVGPSGPQGIQGIPGTNGTNGSTGPQGPQGIQGVAGVNGVNGTDGRSAYEIAVLNGFVGTETQWLLSLVGATGPSGASGTAGATGPQGPAGNDGAMGPQGPIGLTGAQGPIGLTGPQGPQGIQGPVGNDGATGPQGPAGNDGATGSQGPIGLTGPQGLQGIQGPVGNDGATGPQGSTGNEGATGPQGPIGLTGPQGAQGLLDNGTAAGNTPYWNGSQWVVNGTNFYNNGASVGVGTNIPANSAQLDVSATDKGFLAPRLTTAQRDAIVNPDDGLIIFNISSGCPNYYFGGIWFEWCGTGVLPAATISSLDCGSSTTSGTLTQSVAASGVSATIPYSGANGGTYSAQSFASTGVAGLVANLASGTLASGSGSVSYTISGTPASFGTASFNLLLAGQTCTLTIQVNQLMASLTALNCAGATTTGSLLEGTPGSAVSTSVPYTGGNGGSYTAQTISSTGVSGLTATLTSGILANGAGSLSLAISGTPATSGTASFALTIGGQSCSFTVSVQSALAAQYPTSSVFCASGPTAIVDVTNPTTGKIWMDRNLGASQVATSSTDAAAYGDLYQWGRRADGHQCRTSPTTATLSSIDQPTHGNFILAPNAPYDWRSPQNANLWQGVNGVNNPCPSGYRIPTETEINAERLSWSANTSVGAFATPLKLSIAGYRQGGSGSLIGVGTYGYYFSSSVSGTGSRTLYFLSSDASMVGDLRAYGFSIRCIKDASAIPATLGALNCGSSSITGTLTSGTAASSVSASVPYTGGNGGSYAAQTISSTGVTGLTATLTAGILANGSGSLSFAISGTPATSGTASFALTLGGQSCSFTISVAINLITAYPANSVFCASGPTAIVDVTSPTGKIWMDRNLGASQVATSSTDAAAYGDLYQWGRGNDGHQCRNSATTSTLSSTDTPANGNFILSSSDWRSPQNNNLWQGVNGVNNPCPTGYRVPTETELNNERLSWSNINGAGAFSNALKWTQGGGRSGVGLINSVGSIGVYWSSTIQSLNSIWLRIENGTSFTANSIRADAVSVRCIKDASAIPATLGAINCGSTSVTGTLTSGTAASGVSASVPYTGGNGGSYAAQTISSTGVTGLTATLTSGILANGAGSLSIAISGTPATSGTANFALTIGGQSCSFTISVAIDLITAYPTNSVFCASGATAIVDVTNPTTGKIWMDRNLGASQAATSSTDAAAYGDLYQWGRGNDGHQCRTSATTATLSSTDTPGNASFILAPNAPYDWHSPQNVNLWQGVNGVNNPCPSGYRIPTETEINAERLSWSQNNIVGAFASPIKWTLAGYRGGTNSTLWMVGTDGYYWSSTVNGLYSRYLGGFNSVADIGDTYRANGFPVRCIKDASAIPATLGTINCGSTSVTGTLTSGTAASGVSASVPYTGGNGGSYAAQTISSTGVSGLTATLTAGILANGAGSLSFAISGTPANSGTASFALTIGGQSCSFTISVAIDLITAYPSNSVFCASGPTAIVDVTNPTTGKVWMDRNLGASQVATSSTDAAAYGDLYQWGRGNDGHQCRTSATTATLSSTDQPGIASFILAPNTPFDWRSPQNTNLWQGVNGVNNPCPSGYRIPTETELNAERLSWTGNNASGSFNSLLKLTLAGYRIFNSGVLDDVAITGHYWSSSVDVNNTIKLYFNNTIAFTQSELRGLGFSVRCIKDASAIPATLGAINCGSTSVTGTLTSGTAASGVSASVPYTGGNGGSYAAQTISSTGVTGLTATLTAGTLAFGSGSLSFAISGTPAANGTASFALTIGGQTCDFMVQVYGPQPAYPVGSIFCSSGATIVNDVTNPTTGKIWMDRNLGASQVATSSTDAAAYGDLYQWGRRSDGHQCRTSATTTTLSASDTPANGNFIIVPLAPGNWRNPANANLWQGVNGVNNPCPNGYRIPTEAEFNGETSTLTSFDTQGAYASILKWVPGGYRDWGGGSLAGVGTYGGYWASNASNPFSVRWDYNASGGMTSFQQRAHGHSVRCIKN